MNTTKDARDIQAGLMSDPTYTRRVDCITLPHESLATILERVLDRSVLNFANFQRFTFVSVNERLFVAHADGSTPEVLRQLTEIRHFVDAYVEGWTAAMTRVRDAANSHIR